MDIFDSLLAWSREAWEMGVLGLDWVRIATALVVFFGFFILRAPLGRAISATLRRPVKRLGSDPGEQMIAALDRPFKFFPVVIGAFIAIDHLDLPGIYAEIGENLSMTLISYNIFWFFYAAAEPASAYLSKLKKIYSVAMVNWTVRASKVLLVLIGLATILEIWGVQVAPIIAAFGLLGVAVALGAQDVFKNLISGLLIIAEKRFRIGDWIRVEGVVEGTVEDIGFRSTMVRRFDKAPVTVPNFKFADTAVINFSAMTQRRIYWTISLTYGTTVAQLREIRDKLEAYVLGSEDFEKPPKVATFVRVDSFNDSSIDLMLYCFTKTTDWGQWLEIKEQLAYHLMEIVHGAGAGFAFPSRTLYLENVSSDMPEVFVPPKEKKKAKS